LKILTIVKWVPSAALKITRVWCFGGFGLVGLKRKNSNLCPSRVRITLMGQYQKKFRNEKFNALES
jgi:hypothetical protein